MGVFQNNLMGAAAAAASAGGGGFYSHQIANSCRFNSSDSAHMYRTQGTPTNVEKCTISLWVKRGLLGADMWHFTGSGKSGGNYSFMGFGGDGDDPDHFYYMQDAGGLRPRLESTALYRDPSSWYHVVVAQDSSQGTAADRNKIYINGVHYTDWGDFTTYSDQNDDFMMNTSGYNIFVGSGGASDGNVHLPFDGYIAEYVFIDGTQYAATDFGESKNGVWIPKDPSGLTFGNNGCYLKFESSSDLGNDSSGNNNDFTLSSVSAHDQMLDSPTFNSDSNGGNFMTFNPLNKGSYTVLSEGNLKADSNTGADSTFPSCTFGVNSGKWYVEHLIKTVTGNFPQTTLVDFGGNNYNTSQGIFYAMRYHPVNGCEQGSGANIADFGTITVTNTSVATLSSGDIVSWYIDMDNKKAWIAKNGSIPNSGDPANGTNPQFSWTENPSNSVTVGSVQYQTSDTILNAGQDGTFAGEKTAQGNADDTGYGNFYYAPDTGFLAMCSGNLPTVAEVDPAETDDDYPQELFFMSQYSGNLTARTITTENQPDLLMIRHYSTGQNWYTLDSTRVITDNKYILTNSDGYEATLPQSNITSVGATSVGISSGTWLNSSGSDYQMWMWRCNGGTTASNGTGDITSTVQADPSGCFSIVKYTGSGTAGDTIGHGLSSVAPNMIMIKNISSVDSWAIYHSSLGNTIHLALDTTAAEVTSSAYWNSTSPTSTVFTVGTGDALNQSTKNYVAYCFANCEGYIKAGSYIANGNADGTFVYTGFSPAFLLIKGVVSGASWIVEDNKLSPVNPSAGVLEPNDNAALYTTANPNADLLSNGFKVRTNNAIMGSTSYDPYVYLAFAHNPFQYATAR